MVISLILIIGVIVAMAVTIIRRKKNKTTVVDSGSVVTPPVPSSGNRSFAQISDSCTPQWEVEGLNLVVGGTWNGRVGFEKAINSQDLPSLMITATCYNKDNEVMGSVLMHDAPYQANTYLFNLMEIPYPQMGSNGYRVEILFDGRQ